MRIKGQEVRGPTKDRLDMLIIGFVLGTLAHPLTSDGWAWLVRHKEAAQFTVNVIIIGLTVLGAYVLIRAKVQRRRARKGAA